MIKVFQSWGYEPLETPTLEPLELFTGEIGEDEKFKQLEELEKVVKDFNEKIKAVGEEKEKEINTI